MMTGNGTTDEVITEQLNATIPKIALSEITLEGKPLGKGGFSVVTTIRSIELDDEILDDETTEMKAARKELASAVYTGRRNNSANNGISTEYVIKTLRTDLSDEERDKGVDDLAIEASFFISDAASMIHDNILQLRGISNSDPRSSLFFVIFDKLQTTLEKKLSVWRSDVQIASGHMYIPYYGYCCCNVPALHHIWVDRIQSITDICDAIQHLHSHHILYRDLKPDNIGYDSNGILKLFDFGLAKQLNTSDVTQLDGDDSYKLTGNTGSLRYMAPEVAMNSPYGYSVDVYSIGILFWQICSLQTPYANLTQQTHSSQVVHGGLRPTPDPSWPQSWICLMESCWDDVPHQRPKSSDVFDTICNHILQDLQHEYDGGLPTRTNEMKAKKKRKSVTATSLDVDTRITPVENDTAHVDDDGTDTIQPRQHDADIV